MVKATHIQEYGNQFRIFYDDGTSDLAVPTQGAIWLVNNPGSSATFKWPFDSESWTTYPMHSGLDWPEAYGTDIPIIGPGTVIEVYDHPGNTYPSDSSEPVWRGCCIVVDHGVIDGIQISSLYAHMITTPAFTVGQDVVGGEIAGQVGNSGYSNGAHLHLEIIYDGDRLTNSEGGGAERTEDWMNAHTDGSNW